MSDQSPIPEYTVVEASAFCSQAGVQVRSRTISRHCELGNLACRKELTIRGGFKYMVPEDELQKLIADTKRFDSQKPAPASTSEQMRAGAGMSTHKQAHAGIGEHEQADASKDDLIRKLKKRVFDLRVLKSAGDQLVEMLKAERGEAMREALDGRQRIGELESKLKQIAAPAGQYPPAPASEEITS